MRNNATFYGTVQNGKLVLAQPQLADQFIQAIPEGSAVELIIRKQTRSKTREQLGYYFACLIKKPSEEFGYGIRPDGRYELDMLFRQMFLTENAGAADEYIKELSDLNTIEMSNYLEHCIQTLAELGYCAEPPDPAWKMQTKFNRKDTK